MKKSTEEWISKADSDFRVAKLLFTVQPPEYDAVCFHSQQCVEKYMKAILEEKNIFFEKIHDLDILSNQIKETIPEITHHEDKFEWLSQYAVESRYPGLMSFHEDAQEALSTAENIRKIIRNYFHLSQELEREQENTKDRGRHQ